MDRKLTWLAALMGAVLVLAPGLSAQGRASSGGRLYDRLGGARNIATVVDDFVDRMLEDPVINQNPALVEIKERTRVPGLKLMLTLQICQASGGPERYTGKNMRSAHVGMNLGERDWQAMLSALRASLASFNVPAREQAELLKIVESTKRDIIYGSNVRSTGSSLFPPPSKPR